MNELFTLKKDLWNRLTSSEPTLRSEATLQKLIALTDYLENEVQSECKLSCDLVADIRILFAKKVWHYKDEEDYELPIEVMLSLLVECIKSESLRYHYSEDEILAMAHNLTELICSIPETLKIHEHKIRAIVIRSYIFEKFTEMGCPEELVCQLVPSHKEIENRLLMDTLES